MDSSDAREAERTVSPSEGPGLGPHWTWLLIEKGSSSTCSPGLGPARGSHACRSTGRRKTWLMAIPEEAVRSGLLLPVPCWIRPFQSPALGANGLQVKEHRAPPKGLSSLCGQVRGAAESLLSVAEPEVLQCSPTRRGIPRVMHQSVKRTISEPEQVVHPQPSAPKAALRELGGVPELCLAQASPPPPSPKGSWTQV